MVTPQGMDCITIHITHGNKIHITHIARTITDVSSVSSLTSFSFNALLSGPTGSLQHFGGEKYAQQCTRKIMVAVDFPFFSGCWLQEEGLEETLLTFQWPPLSLSPSLLVSHVCMRVVSYYTLHAKTTIKSVCMYTQVLRHATILTHTFRNILLLNKHGLYIQTYIQVHFKLQLLLTTQYLKCNCACALNIRFSYWR